MTPWSSRVPWGPRCAPGARGGPERNHRGRGFQAGRGAARRGCHGASPARPPWTRRTRWGCGVRRAGGASRRAGSGCGRRERGEGGKGEAPAGAACPGPARPAPALPTAGPGGGGGGRARPLGVGPRSVPAGDVPPAGDVVPAAPQPGLAELPLPSTHVGVSGNHFVLICRFPSSLPLSGLTGKRRLVRAFCHRVCFFTVLEIYFSFRLPLEFVSPF